MILKAAGYDYHILSSKFNGKKLCVQQGRFPFHSFQYFFVILVAKHLLSVQIVSNMLQLCSMTTSLGFAGNKVI